MTLDEHKKKLDDTMADFCWKPKRASFQDVMRVYKEYKKAEKLAIMKKG